MAQLTRAQRQTLIDLLLRLPNSGSAAARNLLLADLPRSLVDSIQFDNAPVTHIGNIVSAVTSWAVGPGETAEFTGRVVFVRPTLQAGEQYLIYADVENRSANGQWLLQPGMLANMWIETAFTVEAPSPARSAHASR